MTYKKYKLDNELWEIEKKEGIYNFLKNKFLSKHRIEKLLPQLQWSNIWNNWSKIKNYNEINPIFHYLHDMWWTGEVAYKRHVIRSLPKCLFCQKFQDSKTHLILNCPIFINQRTQIIQIIKNTNKTYNTNNLLYTDNITDKKKITIKPL